MAAPEGNYARWAAAHAQGMQAAAAKTSRNRMSGETLSRVRAEARKRHPCKVKDCKRTAHKGDLCKAHWQLVPFTDKVALQMAVMDAQITTTAKWHRKFLRQVNAQLATPSRV
jgi:hypothetical protein